MKRWQRRIWTWSVGTLATSLVLLGVGVGLFRIAVQVAPDYRQALADWVGDLLGSKVAIADMDLAWRGVYPTLVLRELIIGADTGAFIQLDEMQLGFAVHRLLTADPTPARVSLIGPAVTVVRDESGLSLAGLQGRGKVADVQKLANRLLDIGEVVVRDATLIWRDTSHDLPDRFLDRLDLWARPRGEGFELRVGQLEFDAGPGRAEVSALFERMAWPPRTASVALRRWFPWSELRAWFPDLPAVTGEVQSLNLELSWGDAGLDQARGRMVVRQPRPLAEPEFAHERAAANFQLLRVGGGWRLDLTELELSGPAGDWPQSAAALDFRPQGAGWRVALSASFLRLQDLLVWGALLPREGAELLRELNPTGDVSALVAQFQTGQLEVPELTAQLRDVSWQARAAWPGVAGLSGEISAGSAQGRLRVDSANLRVESPTVFAQPLVADRLNADLRWSREGERWRLQSTQMALEAMGLNADGRLDILTGADPQVDIKLELASEDPRRWLAYQPLSWPPSLRDWLSRAVESARVPHGLVHLAGPLGRFPYADGGGVFRVELELQNVDLSYAEDWPRVTGVDARLLIEGRELTVTAAHGEIHGATISAARAYMADLKRDLIVLSADVSGDAGDLFGTLEDSPLRTRYQDLVASLALAGPADFHLDLQLPLRQLSRTRFKGRAKFAGVRLKTSYWPEAIAGIRGEFTIDESGLSGRGLTAKLANQSFKVDLTADAGTTRLKAHTRMDLRRHGTDWSVPAWLCERTQGKSDWQVSMAFGGVQPEPIIVRSDLVGTALNLPAPFAKAAEASRALEVSIDPAALGGRAMTVALGDQLNMYLKFQADGQALDAAHLHLGPEPAPPAAAPGLWVDGTLDRLVFGEWFDFVTSIGGQDGLRFGGMVLSARQLAAFGQILGETRIQLTADNRQWLMALSGPDVQGRLRWPRVQASARGEVNLEFDRLRWHWLPNESAEEQVDPRRFPQLELAVQNFILNDEPLGRMGLRLEPVAEGVTIKHLRFGNPDRPRVQLTGDWLMDERGSQARVDIAMDTERFAFWLAAFGYQENIRAARGQINGHLQWSPSPEGLQIANMSGDLGITFRDGQLLTVEPGAGRMLGLLSFNALPRRFFLDFRDVVDTGLRFDKIKGRFQIADGQALTDGIVVEGPSLKMEARGRVGLSDRDYDQTITIYPGLSSGVTLAATVLGGPAAGLFALFAQELLDKPLDQVGQLSYHLGGTWDNPVVTKEGQ